MIQVKEKDFVEVEYTGKVEGSVFDTTSEKIAKDNGIHEEKASYGPVKICVGEGQVLSGLDKALVGKDIGKEYTVELEPEDAFGKKNAKMIQLVQTSKFLKQNIQPMPGLQVNIDGMMGMIKTVSGGRTLVDLNHPLSGKQISYSFKVLKKIDDDKEKLTAFLKIGLGQEPEVKLEEGKATISPKIEMPKEAQAELSKKIKELIPGIKEINYKKV